MADPGQAAPDATGEGLDVAIAELEGTFNRLVRQYRQQLAEEAEAMAPGLALGAMKAFLTIRYTGPLTPSALAARLMLDRAQVSRVLRELEGHGLVHRESDPQDRRSTLVTATEEARRRLDDVRGGPGWGRMAMDLAEWDVSDVRALSALLGRYVDARERRGQTRG